MSDDAPVKPPEYCDCDRRCQKCGKLKEPEPAPAVDCGSYGVVCAICGAFIYRGNYHYHSCSPGTTFVSGS